MIPLSHLSFAQGGQVKCLPKEKVIIKVSYSIVAEGTVCVCGGGGGGGGGGGAGGGVRGGGGGQGEGCKGRQA